MHFRDFYLGPYSRISLAVFTLTPNYTPDEATHAIHLWNEMWRRNQQDKNHQYHPDCLYEQLKRKYLG
jgi:hypothetical protein